MSAGTKNCLHSLPNDEQGRSDLAKAAEGMCPNCDRPSSRDDFGAHCECCGASWRVVPPYIEFRLPLAAFALVAELAGETEQ